MRVAARAVARRGRRGRGAGAAPARGAVRGGRVDAPVGGAVRRRHAARAPAAAPRWRPTRRHTQMLPSQFMLMLYLNIL